MKKVLMILTGSVLLMSSCGTYTGEGAYAGATFGSILGSAIGGISGGWRGSDVGTIVGMAGGAVVGAAIGAAADQKEQKRYEVYDNSGYDARGRGDDRIDFDAPGPRDGRGTYSAAPSRTYTPKEGAEPGYHVRYNSMIEIRNARVIDADRDGILRAGEECKVTFEIMNNSSKMLYDVQPTVFDVTGNKHIHISPNLHVERIAPNTGVRYTASILADKKLKDGIVVIRVGVAQGNKEITSQMKEFSVQTRRR